MFIFHNIYLFEIKNRIHWKTKTEDRISDKN